VHSAVSAHARRQRLLYEIHTATQSDIIGAILSMEHVDELARFRDFLGK
jgi:hypothetical protein